MSFYDDVYTIKNATYGKEIRPAISNALTASWDAVNAMMEHVDSLNARVDALTGGGGSGDGGGDILMVNTKYSASVYDGSVTDSKYAGSPTYV